MLQAALRGVYVSAGSYDLALHGIDNVEMSTMVVNATGQRIYYSKKLKLKIIKNYKGGIKKQNYTILVLLVLWMLLAKKLHILCRFSLNNMEYNTKLV